MSVRPVIDRQQAKRRQIGDFAMSDRCYKLNLGMAIHQNIQITRYASQEDK